MERNCIMKKNISPRELLNFNDNNLIIVKNSMYILFQILIAEILINLKKVNNSQLKHELKVRIEQFIIKYEMQINSNYKMRELRLTMVLEYFILLADVCNKKVEKDEPYKNNSHLVNGVIKFAEEIIDNDAKLLMKTINGK